MGSAGFWIVLAAFAGCTLFIVWVFKPRVTLHRLESLPDEVTAYESVDISLALVLGKGFERYPKRPFIRITNQRIVFGERMLSRDDVRIIAVFVFAAGRELVENHRKNGFYTFLADRQNAKTTTDFAGKTGFELRALPTYGAWVKANVTPYAVRIVAPDSEILKGTLARVGFQLQ